MAAAGVDAYFGVRREHMRYLTGFTLAEGEEKSAGNSGQFLVSGDDLVLLTDSRYTIQAGREATDAQLVEAYNDLPSRWRAILASVGARRVAIEAGFVPHAQWLRLAEAAPDVELVPVEGWIEADRAIKEPAEVERIAAAWAVADRARGSVARDRARPPGGDLALASSGGCGPGAPRRSRRRFARRPPSGAAARRPRRPADPLPVRSCCSTWRRSRATGAT
jgi:Xaa-Pro aminopeptidase